MARCWLVKRSFRAEGECEMERRLVMSERVNEFEGSNNERVE